MAWNYFLIKNENEHLSRPPCLDGMVQFMRGILLYEEEALEKSNVFLLTFNKDRLENFFSIIRHRGADNSNPTCRIFRKSFRTLLRSSIIWPTVKMRQIFCECLMNLFERKPVQCNHNHFRAENSGSSNSSISSTSEINVEHMIDFLNYKRNCFIKKFTLIFDSLLVL